MSTMVGTLGLIRLILRRDRWLLPLWILFLAVVPLNYVAFASEVYPTAAALEQYARTSATNATYLALYGPLFDASIGGVVAQRAGFLPVIVALISLLTVIRHTRTEEEAGRRELLGSTVVGRHAGLAAALIVTVGANLALAVLLRLGLISQDLPAGGSFALGLSLALTGCVFAAIGGLTAQLSESAGAARGIAVAVLGAAYVVRVAGDVGSPGSGLSGELSGEHSGGLHWLSWLSPIGWAHRIRAYGDEAWWVLALAAGVIAVLAAGAVALSARRDVGAGVLAPRLGPATAPPSLGSPLGLAWRLHRGLLAGWTAGFAVLGVVFGGIAEGVGDLLNSPNAQDIVIRLGGQSALIDAFLAANMGVLGLIASAYAVQAALRLRTEETAQRAEPVLATSASRLSVATSHLVFSLLGPAVALAAAGLTTGLVHGLNTGEVGRQVPRLLAGVLIQLPAVWVLAGIAVALFGLLPRLAAVSWGAPVAALVLGVLGAGFGFSQWLLDISPFTHLPKIPGGTFTATPLFWLLVVAALLTAAGLAGFRRRDLAP